MASKLLKYRRENPYVLAMPRGGVPVGFEVAEILQAPLNVIVAIKIASVGNREFGIGAIAEGGVKIPEGIYAESEEKELKRRVKIYRGDRPLPNLKGKSAILVDDGMATGITARAAIEAVKKLHPKKIVLASPVCALDTIEILKKLVDEVICLATPGEFTAVGLWYKNFEQVSDTAVINLLKEANCWSAKVTTKSNALDLEKGVFTFKDPKKIAISLKRSADSSLRKKAGSFQSAMSMLNFYINRAGKNLDSKQKKILKKAKDELRQLFKS